MEIAETLEALCKAEGVSGAESAACRAALEILKKYTDKAEITPFGCVRGFIGDRNNGLKTVMLEAHIDEIGFIVTYIDEKGFVKAGRCGGTDSRLYAAQTVTIHGENGCIKGVVATLPPHVAADSKKTMKIEDLSIDTGYSKEQLLKLIAPGDRITIDSGFTRLSGSRVTSKALDDRAGVAAVLYALELVKDKQLKYNVEILFSGQEETGSRGAIIEAYNSAADFAIATDVSYAYTPDAKREKCGDMGKGAMIGVSPSLDMPLTEELKRLCKEKNISYQLEIMGGETGTDADEISVSKGGIKTALVSIPLKYMHTPVEVVDTEDVKSVGRIMAEFLTGGESDV